MSTVFLVDTEKLGAILKATYELGFFDGFYDESAGVPSEFDYALIKSAESVFLSLEKSVRASFKEKTSDF